MLLLGVHGWQLTDACSLLLPVPFDVDEENAQNNGPLCVFKMGQTIEGAIGTKFEGFVYHGYAIAIKMDVRFVLDSPQKVWYSGRVTSTNGEVLIGVPGWDYDMLMNRDAFDSAGKVPKEFVSALDTSHDQHKKNHLAGERIFYKLKFKAEGCQLSAKHTNAASGEDEQLKLDIYQVSVSHKTAKLNNHKETYAVWMVVREDLDSRKKTKSETDKGVSEAAQLLRAMGFDATDDTEMAGG